MLFLSVRGFFDYAGPTGHSRLSQPIVLPSPLRQKVGVLNLGVEGMMLAGAIGAFAVAHQSGSTLLGVFAGLGAGERALSHRKPKTQHARPPHLAALLDRDGMLAFGEPAGCRQNRPRIAPRR